MIQWICLTVELASPRQTCGLQARRQAGQLAESAGEQGYVSCSSQRCSWDVQCSSLVRLSHYSLHRRSSAQRESRGLHIQPC